MTYAGNKRESAGYNHIMGEVRLHDFVDARGTALSHLWALDDVYYAASGECLPWYDFTPGLRDPLDMQGHLASGDGGYPASRYWEMWVTEEFTLDDILRACTVLHRFAGWAKQAEES